MSRKCVTEGCQIKRGCFFIMRNVPLVFLRYYIVLHRGVCSSHALNVCVCVCRVFIPNYISKVKVQLVNCSTKNKSSGSCPVVLKIRARAPPVHNSSALDCREWNPCELETLVPAWEQWYYILVERYLSNSDVYFRIGVQVTGESSTDTLWSRESVVFLFLFLSAGEFDSKMREKP